MISTSSAEACKAGESLCERLLSYWAEREAYDRVAIMEYVDEIVDYMNIGTTSPKNMKTCLAYPWI